MNPGVPPDGSNIDDIPAAKTNPHICNESYSEVTEILLIQFPILKGIVDVQQHIAYAHTIDSKCVTHFDYPKNLQFDHETTIIINEAHIS